MVRQPVWGLLGEDELVEVSVQNRRGWILREDYDRPAAGPPQDRVVRPLPSFDPYMLGHADKNHLADVTCCKRVYRDAGWISPVVLLNGKAFGTWSYARRGSHLLLEIQPLQKYSRRVRAKMKKKPPVEDDSSKLH